MSRPSSLDAEREEQWAALMTVGRQPADESASGDCGGCAEDAPCDTCGTPKGDATHLKAGWAQLVANSKLSLTEFWRTAIMADAFFGGDSTGSVPDSSSMVTIAMEARMRAVSRASSLSDRHDASAIVEIDGALSTASPREADSSPAAGVAVDSPPLAASEWWSGLPVMPITPLADQPACPAPSRWEWMKGPHGEGGHWVCVVPPNEWSVWSSDHWVPGVFPSLQLVPPKHVCCCPTKIEGNAVDGSFGWKNVFPPSEAVPAPPGCAGVSFEADVFYRWQESDAFKPCELRWLENNSRPVEVEGQDVPLHVGMTHDLHRLSPRSPSWKKWDLAMRSESTAKLGFGVDQMTPIADNPCLSNPAKNADGTPDSTGMPNRRRIDGTVVIKSGCPGCPDLRLHWAQLVEWKGEGLEKNWFELEVVAEGAPSLADQNIPNDSARAQWAEGKQQRWKR